MGGKFLPERAAMILVDAAFNGDKRAAEKHGITERTIRNWKARLNYDNEFSAIFQLKKDEASQDWAGDLSGAIKAGIQFLRDAASHQDPKSPDSVHAVAGGLKIMAEIAITKDMLDAKLAGKNREAGEEAG